MTKKNVFLPLAACFLAVIYNLAPPAQADVLPVTETWYLTDVVFNDGGTANGWFQYNAQFGTIGALSIYTTAGSIYPSPPAGGYQAQINSGPDYLLLVAGGPDAWMDWEVGDPAFRLLFVDDLPAFGGSMGIVSGPGGGVSSSEEGYCFTGNCSVLYPVERYVVGGYVTTELVSPVPLPAAFWLLGGALTGLGVLKRRQAKA